MIVKREVKRTVNETYSHKLFVAMAEFENFVITSVAASDSVSRYSGEDVVWE